ncbi:MAG: cobyric acid synthase [Bacteroidaceae bacterium]|nr:cobyric acid synthase [Bacteroidaceae bacterium]
MLQGHGDDAYRYTGIRHNFSSNIFSHADLSGLKTFLSSRLDVIGTYPEPEPCALERLIAEQSGVGEECVLVTSGATEAIYLIAESWKALPYEISQPTFSEYADACQAADMQQGSNGILWLCNPNNPTGSVMPKADVLGLAKRYHLLVLDQSYEDYTLAPFLSPVEAVAAGNILQLHSLTKTYCIPGLRIGYVVGAAALIGQLRQRLRPWSVNALAIEAATWLIRNHVRVLPELTAYLAEAQRLRNALHAIDGISVEPTSTNFMLCRLDERLGITAAELKEHLATRNGLLIRDASNFEGLTPYHFRVAAQTREEDDELIDALNITNEESDRMTNDESRSARNDESKSQSNHDGKFHSSFVIRHSSLHNIMLCGTGSDAGKSVLATALCRIFRQDGYHPAPFKAQNMALNSYATPEGLEIGRAQAVQAEAAGIPCHTDMNPLLLKPQSDHTSQVVLHGRPIGNKSAYDYWKRSGGDTADIDFRKEVCSAFDRLAARYNPIVMEGAGSISELNLRATDLVNLPMARHADANVILVADIDRGGVFASVYGSIMLQTPEDRARIKGIIINKFRGDLRLFDDGRRMIEELTGVPVLGVIPYFKDIHIEEEDSVSLSGKSKQAACGRVNIAVIMLRHLSNFTDFDALEQDARVHLYYTNNVEEISKADIIIVPGSKSTLDDLYELRRNGVAQAIQRAHRDGKTVIGICGGYQMMGIEVCDPDHVEGDLERLPGLGLLPTTTTMSGEKVTRQVQFSIYDVPSSVSASDGFPVGTSGSAYEIHMGETRPFGDAPSQPFALLDDGREDGYRVSNRCWGTYLHGVLDNAPVVDALLAPFADRFNAEASSFDYAAFKEEQYDRLADHVRKHLDMARLYRIMTNDE